jgi:hypothetical protein
VGDTWRRTGHCGLGRAVASLGLRAHKPTKVDFVVSMHRDLALNQADVGKTSSVGSLTDEFLRSIYLSSQGTMTFSP